MADYGRLADFSPLAGKHPRPLLSSLLSSRSPPPEALMKKQLDCGVTFLGMRLFTVLTILSYLHNGKLWQVDAAVDVAPAQSSLGAMHSSHEQREDKPRFETCGPTITITLRDPVMSSRGRSGISSSSSGLPRSRALVSSENPMSIDSQFEGLVAKLAARFHISSETAASTELKQTPPQFSNGYMLDGGNIMLGPPSDSKYDQPAKQFFPLFGALGSRMRWTDCVSNIQPELAYKVRSRFSNNSFEDTRPFPGTLPWVNAVSCGLKWRPFPIYKPGEGYGHKLMTAPHYVRCGASISFPRLSNILRPWKSADSDELYNELPHEGRLDLDVTYLDDISRKGGKVDVLLGQSSPYLQPQYIGKTMNSRLKNHILACFATGKNSAQSSLASSIEYIRGSIHIPFPSFFHKRLKGMSISPSYNFVESKARLCVSGDVGTSGRTSAVLRLDSEDSTLTVVRALDERKVIAPTISLQTGKIVYDWHVGLNNKSSVRAHVDPTNGIRVVWTDSVIGKAAGNCWITEMKVPLGVTAAGSRIGDIRVVKYEIQSIMEQSMVIIHNKEFQLFLLESSFNDF